MVIGISYLVASPPVVSSESLNEEGVKCWEKEEYSQAVSYFAQAMNQGSIDACNNLGWLLEFGLGCEQNSQEALRLYHYAADRNCVQAQNNLGRVYEEGVIVEKNMQEAIKWYTKVAEQGDEFVQYHLSKIYRFQGNEDLAFFWLTQASNKGLACAQNLLGYMWENGIACQKNEQYAQRLYEIAAEQKATGAMINLGLLYEKQGDIGQAISWLSRAIQTSEEQLQEDESQENIEIMQGLFMACSCLGDLYKKERRLPVAICNYTKVAEMGFLETQLSLGLLHYEEKNYQEAFKWYEIAAQQKSALAQNRLGLMYLTGQGCNKSESEAFRLIQSSAEQGYVKAMVNLGRMYTNGLGCLASDDIAFTWYKRAAEQGSASAQYIVGQYYEKKERFIEAIAWCEKAAKQGHEQAKHQLSRLTVPSSKILQVFHKMQQTTRRADRLKGRGTFRRADRLKGRGTFLSKV